MCSGRIYYSNRFASPKHIFPYENHFRLFMLCALRLGVLSSFSNSITFDSVFDYVHAIVQSKWAMNTNNNHKKTPTPTSNRMKEVEKEKNE